MWGWNKFQSNYKNNAHFILLILAACNAWNETIFSNITKSKRSQIPYSCDI